MWHLKKNDVCLNIYIEETLKNGWRPEGGITWGFHRYSGGLQCPCCQSWSDLERRDWEEWPPDLNPSGVLFFDCASH